MKEKIFVVLPRIPWPLEKGDKLRAYYFLKGLQKHYDITLFALYKTKYDNEIIEKINEVVTKFYFFKITNLSIFFNAILVLFTNKPFQVAYFKNCKMKRAIRNKFKEVNPNIVFCQLARTAQYAKGLNCKKILDYQDAFSKGLERRIPKANILMQLFFKEESRRLKKYETLIADWFDRLMIITEQDRDDLMVEKERVEIMPNGVDIDYYFATENKKENELLFVGNMSYAPNVNAMLYFTSRILPYIIEQIPDVVLYIVGATPHWRLKSLDSENIVVTGWVDDPREYYKRCTVFVAPMQIGTGLQNKLLEAMAMGCSSMTTTLANNALNAKDNEEIVVANTDKEWIEKTVDLLKNKEKRSIFAKKARTFVVDNYSWQAKFETLLKIIKI